MSNSSIDFDVKIVIGKDVLDEIFHNDKYNAFIRHWLVENETKAIVDMKSWKEFNKEWVNNLKDCTDEIKNPFFASIKGIVRPYREELAQSDIEEQIDHTDSITSTVSIVNRHYATCQALIVKNVNDYKSKKIKIGSEFILTPKEFYILMSSKNPDCAKRFLDNFKDN